MQQLTDQQRLKPWMGFVLFVVVLGLFLTVCSYMQANWGIFGLLGTEFLFLLIAIGYALIFKIPLKEMFPIKKFSARDFFGSLLLVSGGVLFGFLSIAVVGLLIPSSLESGDVTSISEFINNGPGYIVMILIIAVTPAICEEAIHRGAILANFRSIKKDWVIVLIMGLFFGLNHWSVLRFLNTAIMGACLTYIVVKKNNIILSSIMHFTLNFSSATLSYLSSLALMKADVAANATLSAESLKLALGSFMMICIPAPFFIVLGLLLLNPSTHKKIRFLFAGIAATVLLVCSFATTTLYSWQYLATTKVLQDNINYTVTQENTMSSPLDFEVKEDGYYLISCVAIKPQGTYSVRIENEDGSFVIEEEFPTDGAASKYYDVKTYTSTKYLEAGSYKFLIVNGKGTLGDSPTFTIQINRS